MDTAATAVDWNTTAAGMGAMKAFLMDQKLCEMIQQCYGKVETKMTSELGTVAGNTHCSHSSGLEHTL